MPCHLDASHSPTTRRLTTETAKAAAGENQDSRGLRRDVSRPRYFFSVLFFNTILMTIDILDISSPSRTKSSSSQWSVRLVPCQQHLYSMKLLLSRSVSVIGHPLCLRLSLFLFQRLLWALASVLFTNYVFRYKKYCLLQYRCPGTRLYEDPAVFRCLRVDQVNNYYGHDHDYDWHGIRPPPNTKLNGV